MYGRFPRRVFLKLVLASLASACAPKKPALPVEVPLPNNLLPPTRTPLPPPTPTPPPSADGTAAAYLAALTAGDYDTMYDLLVDADRLSMSSDQFRARYV